MSWVIKADKLDMEPMHRAIEEFLGEMSDDELRLLTQPDERAGQDLLDNAMGDLLSYLDNELIDSPAEIDYAIKILPELAQKKLQERQERNLHR